jgi:PIN like domain
MRLDTIVRDYQAFMLEFADALEAQSTRFYLDTSLLMWLIRLGPQARSQFIEWCHTRPTDAVRVPIWAAHELHHHVIAGTVRSNVQKTISDTLAKYDEFRRLASERADDAICLAKGYADRTSYIAELEQSVIRLDKLSKVIELDDPQIRQAADEVIEFVNVHVLASDIAPLMERLSVTGAFRFSHHVPPGFLDRKEENRYGDVIIWEEIIEDLSAARLDHDDHQLHAVFISRDSKTDWVSAAPFVRNLAGQAQRPNRDQELDVTLAHPLLVHDFAHRAKGDRLYISHPGFLASVLTFSARRRGETCRIESWHAAAHRSDLLSRLAGSLLPDATTPIVTERPASPAQPVAVPAPTRVVAPDAAESALDIIDTGSILALRSTTEVLQYQEALPGEQSDLLVGWLQQLVQGDLSPYKVGQVIAELSIRESPGWPEQVPAVLESLAATLDSNSLNRFALSLIMHAYFDRFGDPLRRPRAKLGAVVLDLERDERLRPAFRALHRLLTQADIQLPYVPGAAARRSVRFDIDLMSGSGNTPRHVRDIRLGGESTLTDLLDDNSPRSLSSLLGRSPSDGCFVGELRMLIAHEYLVPADLLSGDQNDKRRLTWSPAAALVTLDTVSAGGLSALADEDDGNG